MRAIVYSTLAMLLCALLTRVTYFFFSISLAPLAIIGALISLGIALLTAGGRPSVEPGLRDDVLALLAAVALSTTAYLAIGGGIGGAAFYAVLLAASVALLVYTKPRIPREFSASAGLLAGLLMFVVALILVAFLSLLGFKPEETVEMLKPGWSAEHQTTALANMFIVAPVEELWRYATLLSFLASGSSAAEAVWLTNAWFIFLHAPTRLQYGLTGLVVLAIIGIVVLPFWFIAGRRHPVTAIIAHATYNVLISSLGPALLIEVPILLLLVYLLRRRELPGIRIEVSEEALKPEKLVREVVGR